MEKRIYIKAHLNTDRTFECKTLREANLLVHSLQFQGWRIIDMFERERILPTISVYIYKYGSSDYIVETSENQRQFIYGSLRDFRRHFIKNGIFVPLTKTFKHRLENEGQYYLYLTPYDSELDLDEIAA